MTQPSPEKTHISLKEVARSIGWLDRMGDGELEFDSADWSKVKKTGLVRLEGRKGDLLVWVTVKIKEVIWERDWDADPDYVDCTCGHPEDDHSEVGACPYKGCGCGAGLENDDA